MATPSATPRGGIGLSRRATMMTPGSALAEQPYFSPLHVPDFLARDARSAFPSTITASGYVKGMPVAYEPEPTPRKPAQQQQPPPPEQHVAAAAAVAGGGGRRRGKGGRPSALDRRSTLPEPHALRDMVLPPPLLHSSLTPSCERCAVDADEMVSVQASQVYCLECEQFYCGSEAIDDGMPAAALSLLRKGEPATITRKHHGCNLRLHRHRVMQGHVRIAASTAMQLNKLEAEEVATKPEGQRRSRKELLLFLFTLPMKRVVWQYQSLSAPTASAASAAADEDSDHKDASGPSWIEFDLLTQHKLEQAFGLHADVDRSKQLSIAEQYSVGHAALKQQQHQLQQPDRQAKDGEEPAQVFEMINTLTKTRFAVRRLDMRCVFGSLQEQFGSGGVGPRPNTRPNSVATTPRVSAPSSPPSRAAAATATSWRRTSLSLASNGGSQVGTPLHSASSARFPFSSGGVAPLALESAITTATMSLSSARSLGTTPRPGLSRHASMDAVQMYQYEDFLPAQWDSFARAQPSPAAPVAETTAVDKDGAKPEEEKKEELFPLFDMERGNALLLAVYYNAQSAVETLLAKGFSASTSTTSWTHLSALQLAALQGNDAIAALLLDAGADPAYHSSTPTLALEYAAKSGSLPLLRRLLDIRRTTGARLSYSDVLLHEGAKRKAKRSTWVDIADEADGGGGGSGAKGPQAAAAAFAAVAAASSAAASAMASVAAKDKNFKLYPHLLTEALNVPPIQAHSLDVVRFLLDEMLERATLWQRLGLPQAPKFELSRYHEWMGACISSSSVERVRFMVRHWTHYTQALQSPPLRSMSDVFEEHLSHERYARAVLAFQPSVDALFFQACTQHPASEEEAPEDRDDEEDEEEDADGGGDDDDDEENNHNRPFHAVSSDSSSGSFEILRFLLDEAGADVNVVLRDGSDGTELTPLLMSIRDRKPFLCAFLVAGGADVERRHRAALVELPADADLTLLDPPVERSTADDEDADSAERGRAWQMLLPLEFARDECAFDADELEGFERAMEQGLERRHAAAQKLVRVVHDVSRMMAGMQPEGEGDSDNNAAAASELLSPPPVTLSPTAPSLTLSEHFNVHILHAIAAFCCGPHALAIGAVVSAATGMPLSRPPSPGD